MRNFVLTSYFEELYQAVNRQAIAPFLVPRLSGNGRVLDAGSGPGFLAQELNLQEACFVDIDAEHVRRCRNNIGGSAGSSFIRADIRQLPFRDRYFDAVICSNVLHYTGLEGLKDLLRVTRSGGQLFLAFLEDSVFTRNWIGAMVFSGLFPSEMLNARLIDLANLARSGVKIVDSATVVSVPPFFHARRELPRNGLVIFQIER